MKKILIIAFFALCFQPVHGQNIVPNGSFEEFDNCPPHYSDFIGFCRNWYSFTNGTPDYFNACNTTTTSGVPANALGYQQAIDGQAYAGIVCSGMEIDYAEYIGVEIPPLQVGMIYEVSMSVSVADSVRLGIDGLGAIFTEGRGFVPTYGEVKRPPHVSYSKYGILTDATRWVRLVDTFIADRPYDQLVIGTFAAQTNTDTVRVLGQKVSYYYIDSVVVRPGGWASSPPVTLDVHDRRFCIGDSARIDYTVSLSDTLYPGNVFTLELLDDDDVVLSSSTSQSRVSGTIPLMMPDELNSGKYRLRFITSAPPDTLYLDDVALDTYPGIVASSDAPTCFQNIVMRAETHAAADVSWYGPNDFSTTGKTATVYNANSEHGGVYTAVARVGKCNSSDTVLLQLNCQEIQVPSAFSPNGDGVNDLLTLYGAEHAREVLFRVYNRWGQIVFETNDANRSWDGRHNGTELDAEALAYVLHAVYNDGHVQAQSGSITIVK